MSKRPTLATRPAPMTPAAAARIQSAVARANGGRVPKGSVAARAQRAAARTVAK